ncbi:MAG: hypothetical protein IKK17_01240 [Oscillospiraceae bacterium]|nr:hypothetical protein [Oscillospiraceae bacterium]
MRRYDGNTGRYIHIPDEGPTAPKQAHTPQSPPPPKPQKTPPPKSFGSGLQGFLSNIFAQGFDTEDLLLFAVLFLMYRESGDKELLIIMGGMFLL